MNHVLYVQRWSRQTRRPFPGHTWIDPSRARQLYESGDDFIEVLDAAESDPDGRPHPRWSIGFATNGFVRTSFYNEAGSMWHSSDYEPHDGRLFRAHVYDYTYPDGAVFYLENQCTRLTRFFFRPDGTGAVETRDKGASGSELGQFTDANVSGLWVDRPEFGQWSSLADAEHGKAAPADARR